MIIKAPTRTLCTMPKPSFEKERLLWMSFTIILLLGSLIAMNKSKREATNASHRVKILLQREADLRSVFVGNRAFNLLPGSGTIARFG